MRRQQRLGLGALGESHALAGESAARPVAGQRDSSHAGSSGGFAPCLQRIPLQPSNHLVQTSLQDHPVPPVLLQGQHATLKRASYTLQGALPKSSILTEFL